MTSLFHFEEKIHRKNLTRVEAIPLLFPRLLSQVLEHLGFPIKPHLKRRRVCEAIFTVEKWKFVPSDPLLPLRDPVEDHPPPAAPAEEPHIQASTVPIATSPLPASSKPPVPLVPVDSVGPSTSAALMETIPFSPRDFLAIMTSVHIHSYICFFFYCPCCLGRADGTNRGHPYTDQCPPCSEQSHPCADSEPPRLASDPSQSTSSSLTIFSLA